MSATNQIIIEYANKYRACVCTSALRHSSAALAVRQQLGGGSAPEKQGHAGDACIHPRTPIRGQAAPLRVCRAAEWRRWWRRLGAAPWRILCGPTRIRVRALCSSPATAQANPSDPRPLPRPRAASAGPSRRRTGALHPVRPDSDPSPRALLSGPGPSQCPGQSPPAPSAPTPTPAPTLAA
jgi:hypothetical protein